ncbi:ABC transporter permease subunit [Nocardiopsis alba]|uniref:ABC transporter permease subunit n=1 Tax=Nocardiopsis alba TaxID=53437 RepID=A0A7K2IY00_9ACTN|nr:ABC transporter permease [Nocardiopsis alba]MYR34819.1 ABC transporter permease subunit [Nocardiopsis alba]
MTGPETAPAAALPHLKSAAAGASPLLSSVLFSLFRGALLLVLVSAAVFTATELLPGDAADLMASPGADEEQTRHLREELGLDAEPWRRYLDWAGALLSGDMGTSLVNGRPVADSLAQRLPATLALVVGALLIAAPASLGLAWWAGTTRRGRRISTAVLTGGAAVPTAVTAAALAALFSGAFALVPPVSLLPPGDSPWHHPDLLFLPVVSMALPTAFFGGGLLAGSLADIVRLPHVADARRRGVPSRRIALVDVLPFLLAPFVRVLAVSAGGLIAAAAVVETLFGYPGLGSLLVSAISTRDLPVVQATAVLAAAVVLLGLLLGDVVAVSTEPTRGRAS